MEKMNKTHSSYPQSNIHKYSGYQPQMYALASVPPTVQTNESLIPGCPPRLTQQTVGMYLQPLSRELTEVPLSLCLFGLIVGLIPWWRSLGSGSSRPTIDDLPEAVIDNMLERDKAFWVDKPEANAYTLHDAYYNLGIFAEKIKPPHQDVFPRSYQYDLECVKYRRHHACDGLRHKEKPIASQCRDCYRADNLLSTPPSEDVKSDAEGERWRYYPDVNTPLSAAQIREFMDEVGRPFKNDACNWYYKKYPPQKFDCILRKFSK